MTIQPDWVYPLTRTKHSGFREDLTLRICRNTGKVEHRENEGATFFPLTAAEQRLHNFRTNRGDILLPSKARQAKLEAKRNKFCLLNLVVPAVVLGIPLVTAFLTL